MTKTFGFYQSSHNQYKGKSVDLDFLLEKINAVNKGQ